MFDDGICLVLDLGGEQARLTARKVRGERVYCDVLPYDAPIERIRRRSPRGVILAGGIGDPFSEHAVELPDYVYQLGVPILGIGYGCGLLLRHAGAALTKSVVGRGTVEVKFLDSPLFQGLETSDRAVSRVSELQLPGHWHGIATVEDGAPVAFERDDMQAFGMEFAPEQNDPDGLAILHNFVVNICGCAQDWTMDRFINDEIDYIRAKVGDKKVLMTMSGGMDSSACAAMIAKALGGQQMICLFVDTGLMRIDSDPHARMVASRLPGVTFEHLDAKERFLRRLQGVTAPTEKRLLVTDELLNVYEEYIAAHADIGFVAQGLTYDDILMQGARPFDAPERTVRASRLEPARRLFKDEVQLLGETLNLPPEITKQQSFPGAGFAVRCLGEVTAQKLNMLRVADAIFSEEIENAGLSKRIKQYFAILTGLETGDSFGRSGQTVALRAVNWTGGSPAKATSYRLPYDLLERVVERIVTEVSGINRVVYDITGKPPAGIEWD